MSILDETVVSDNKRRTTSTFLRSLHFLIFLLLSLREALFSCRRNTSAKRERNDCPRGCTTVTSANLAARARRARGTRSPGIPPNHHQPARSQQRPDGAGGTKSLQRKEGKLRRMERSGRHNVCQQPSPSLTISGKPRRRLAVKKGLSPKFSY